MAHSPTPNSFSSESLLLPPHDSPIQKKKKKWKKKNNINNNVSESQLNLNDSTQQQLPHFDSSSSQARKRNRCPGVRIRGGRIFDSENGRTCHQCRQKTMDFVASCKSRRGDKPCRFMFCLKCLSNRYGEKAEEANQSDDWKCPKCRGVCNCSFCMKKRGHQPTGILVHAAKATGFQSVLEMLTVNGPENIPLSLKQKKLALQKENTSDGRKNDGNVKGKGKKADLSSGMDLDERTTDRVDGSEYDTLKARLKKLARAKKIKSVKCFTDEGRRNSNEHHSVERNEQALSISEIDQNLARMKMVDGGEKKMTKRSHKKLSNIELPAEDVQQFLEFCNAFGEELLSKELPDAQVLKPAPEAPLEILASWCNFVHTIS